MPPFQVYVNDEKIGPHHWSLSYAWDIVKELYNEDNSRNVYIIHVASGSKMYQYPSPFTHE